MTLTEKIETESGVPLVVEKKVADDSVELVIRMADQRKCLLHWGVPPDSYSSWQLPPKPLWPEGSAAFDSMAVQSPFAGANGESEVRIRFGKTAEFPMISFVLFFPEEKRWDNNRGKNYRIMMPGYERPVPPSTDRGSDAILAEIAEAIIGKEMSRNSWTLMHRFNLCYDILDKAGGHVDALALIFVWLRFSALRQLDWQRNYNTQPRELAHAMDRLTLKLSGLFINAQAGQEMMRLILTTLGRGGEGQRVRDEILNIMHRHHIKEVSGHFLEEWHQKLHNNTTPDDVVICEAFLEFMRSNGNLDRFYSTLETGGVTKKRLEGYERPIRSHPDFIPHLKDALIYDFEHFLGILKSVHSGTDLGTAMFAARRLFDAEMNGLMDFIWWHRDDRAMPLSVLVGKVTEARRRLSGDMKGRPEDVRDLLFLDLSLEDFLRVVIERSLHPGLGAEDLFDLITMVLENLSLSVSEAEFDICLRHWKRLADTARSGREWWLHAKSILDRLQRATGVYIDRYHNLLQPKAEFLGKAFHADSWTITLFSEEVLRGRPVFVLSALMRYIDPVLRRNADLGNWQIISPGRTIGTLEVLSALKSIQGKSFDTPTVIVTEEVGGDEEIPEGVAAIITPVPIDILAHLSVRARNSHVLFATCYDTKNMTHLKSLIGKMVKIGVSPSGDVIFEESYEEAVVMPVKTAVRRAMSRPGFTSYAVPIDDFNEHIVGGKSNNLKILKTRVPSWVRLPASAALPFGVFEKVLAEDYNRQTAVRCHELSARIEETTGDKRTELLTELRRSIGGLNAPEKLTESLRKVMEETGLGWPGDWDRAWTCIKRVWASKWNERAYLSRRAQGIPHEELFMAVLIQQVVAADYSYVIHTVNPFTGNRDETYAEAVLGLGEALVGNYPGRALSFKCKKGDDKPELLSFPGKGAGLYGSGLIFRSDSNGEDIEGYAGAGLYDSFMLNPAKKVSLDYIREPLVWDEQFRKDFMVFVSNIGIEIENIMETPQDIEGAVSAGTYFVVQSRPQVGIEND